ncbi:hypothetical protein WR25_19789 isoform B [Diploscapter pachys]|uniref:Uncharacterized protein n=1 Tax=Diploscapter pachys TaxID=2018661 RepID=A0A2A2JDU0_9BILA|nr:hypothetical protein WR25_19789 isoform B [Diploscapter pachys]
MADVCSGFEPQNYLKDRCRKCFKQKDKHSEGLSPPPVKKERRKSWRDNRNHDNGGPEDDSEAMEILSQSSYLSATSKGMSSAKSVDSMNDTKSMVTAVSESEPRPERPDTPTENDQSLILSMKEELSQLRETNRQLKEEREQYTARRIKLTENGDNSLVKMLEDRLTEAENQIQDYRDENTVLKCELRDLQETAFAGSDDKLKEKIKQTESLCDELMEENEQIKMEVKDLQQEIEEMQDQYREEEIEEFRELQRELELNAKNCRVLQFKLRKAERQKEQMETERNQAKAKVEELSGEGQEANDTSSKAENAKIREFEAELRIAKEVSVRLHNELEQSEEKRYKLEDEVFYLKEKIRELQTQNKWREARNKTDNAVKRLSAELAASVPIIPDGDMSKELRDALEREIDIREQLRFTEEDLKRTQLRLQDIENENETLLKKLTKASKLRPPMVRSASDGNAQLQLELAEHEVEHLTSKVERLEKTNDHLNKKIVELETDFSNRASEIAVRSPGSEFNLSAEMERDMSKMLGQIAELERKNHELTLQLRSVESSKNSPNSNNNNSNNFSNGSTPIPTPELRSEQEKRRIVEAELTELKQTLLKTDSQKIISLATKVEQLNGQLSLVNERCNTLHKKHAKDNDNSIYINGLKEKIEQLEKHLSEQRATETIAELQGKVPTSDELEQCCEVLAAIESQTSRLCKQVEKMEKIETTQKEERRRSLTKDSSATIIADVANVVKELKNVKELLNSIKVANPGGIPRKSPMREAASSPRGECGRCKENEKTIDEQNNEIAFFKKKNKELTNQVLQTEDRWTIEIEKQRQIFENEIKSLNVRLADAKRQVEEQTEILESKSATLIEKTRNLEENEERAAKLQKEINELKAEMQEKDVDKKAIKEVEIKYKKLESIFDQEREKMNAERSRAKNEMIALKKIAEDAEELLKQTSEELKKKETQWKSEKASLEREVTSLKKQLAAFKNEEPHENDERASSHDSDKVEAMKISRNESDKIHLIDLKKEIALLEKKNADVEAKLEEVKIANAELRDHLKKTESGWQKDKEIFQHKTRQTEKLRTVEMDALQQKFSSRMRIMEDTNKSLHSQLVLARRERDSHKEALAVFEKRIGDEKKGLEIREKSSVELIEKAKVLQKRVADLEEELERVNTDLRLTKEARKADQILTRMDRTRVRDKMTEEEETKGLNLVQQQYKDCEKFYSKEIDRLNDKIKMTNIDSQQQKNEMLQTIRELREQIRVLEIDQRNLSQNKDSHAAAKELIESEAERLQQIVHMHELQKLTRKYRLSSIIDQLQYVNDTAKRSSRGDSENYGGIRYVISQLVAIRDEDANGYQGEERCPSVQLSQADRPSGYAPSISDFGEGTYDNISQSSFSVRSFTSMPARGTTRWSNNKASVTGTINNSSASALIKNPSGSQISQNNSEVNENTSVQSRRKFGSENANSYDRYGRLIKKTSLQDGPSSTFMLSKADQDIPLTSDGFNDYSQSDRMGYNSGRGGIARTSSFDRRSDQDEEGGGHCRSGSAGTNILYRIRREELARGGNPSVKLMAKAFESFDEGTKKHEKRGGFFSIRKSRSVDNSKKKVGMKHFSKYRNYFVGRRLCSASQSVECQ